MPPPRRPPRGKTGKTILLATLSAVTLLGVGSGTAWFVAQGGEPPAPPQTARTMPQTGGGQAPVAQWALPLTNAGSSDFTSGMAFASWLSDTAIIRPQKDGILAYELKTGKRLWGTPSPGEQLCGATPEVHDGLAAIAYGTSTTCDHLAGLDTATGKITWRVEIPAEKSSMSNMLMAPRIVSTDGLVITEQDGMVVAYRLVDGRKQWTTAPPRDCTTRDVNAGNGRLAMLLRCSYPRVDHLRVLDSGTGRVTSTHKIGSVNPSDSVVSMDPLVINTEDAEHTYFTKFGDSGKLGQVGVKERLDWLALNEVVFVDGMRKYHRVVVHGDRVYLASFPENVPGKLRSRNTALAYDLRTGRRLWESSGTSDSILTFIRADNQGLLALETGDRRDLAPRLVRLDATTGRARVLATLPQEFGTEAERARVYEQNGAVIIVPYSSIMAKNAISYFDTKFQ